MADPKFLFSPADDATVLWTAPAPGIENIAVIGSYVVVVGGNSIRILDAEDGHVVRAFEHEHLNTSGAISIGARGDAIRVFAPWNFFVEVRADSDKITWLDLQAGFEAPDDGTTWHAPDTPWELSDGFDDEDGSRFLEAELDEQVVWEMKAFDANFDWSCVCPVGSALYLGLPNELVVKLRYVPSVAPDR